MCWGEITWNVYVVGNEREKGTAKGACDVIRVGSRGMGLERAQDIPVRL